MHTRSLLGARREMTEHFLHALVKLLDIPAGFAGESVTRRSTPNQLLRARVEQVDHESTDLVVFGRSG